MVPVAPELGVPIIDAATVLVLRDDRGPLEVLLVERDPHTAFAPGALVFPGGKVDPADRRFDELRWTGPPIETWRRVLGSGSRAHTVGILAAAVRETFEESGILLARRADGGRLTARELGQPEVRRARRRLAAGEGGWSWNAWLIRNGFVLDFGSLAFWSWWITPHGYPRRFDTRFFVAQLPEGQVVEHDGLEIRDAGWHTPRSALEAAEDGRARIVLPTRDNLRALEPHRDAAEAWRAASERMAEVRRVEPARVGADGLVTTGEPVEPGWSSG